MSKNPFLNALAATAYITAIVFGMYYAPKTIIDHVDGPIIPITFLSLFVLSAAMMGYFFLYQPLLFLFESKPKEATKLFLMTVATFAAITGAVVLTWFFLGTLLQ